MSELKRCPFCGGEAKLVRHSGGYKLNPTTIIDSWRVQCIGCGAYKEAQSNIYQENDGEVKIVNGAIIVTELWNMRSEE